MFMSIYHDEVEIEDMEYDDESELYYYPCPCGDKFQISKVGAMQNLLWFVNVIFRPHGRTFNATTCYFPSEPPYRVTWWL